MSPDFPQNVLLFLFANAILLALGARGVYEHARRLLAWPLWLAAAGALVATLSLPLLTLTSAVMSEVLFVALLFPLLAWGERVVDRGSAAPRGAFLSGPSNRSQIPSLLLRAFGSPNAAPFLLGLAAGALALVRTHAVAAAAAIVLVLLLRRRWRAAISCALGALVPLLPWQIWVALHDEAIPAALRGSYGSYAAWFADGVSSGGITFVGRTVLANSREAAALFADRVAPWTPGWPRLAALAIAGVVLVAGAFRSVRRVPVTTAFVAAYLVVTLAWPYAPWRFLWALWPFVILLIVEGIRGALAARMPAAARLAVGACALLIAAGVVRAEAAAYRAQAWSVPARNAAAQIAPLMRWVTRHTAPTDVLLADAEPLVYLFTGRQAMPPVPFTAREYVGAGSSAPHDEAMADLLARYRVRYVVTVVPSTAATAQRLAAGGATGGPHLRSAGALPNGAAFAVEDR